MIIQIMMTMVMIIQMIIQTMLMIQMMTMIQMIINPDDFKLVKCVRKWIWWHRDQQKHNIAETNEIDGKWNITATIYRFNSVNNPSLTIWWHLWQKFQRNSVRFIVPLLILI